MLSRALILATVALLVGGFAAALAPVQAQNLEAGKSPSQIFAGTCTACHKSARGLLKTVPPGSLTGFLRQHYTTSPEMAGLLSAFLISNGASDTRYSGGRPKRDKAGSPSEEAPEQLDRRGRRLRGAASSQETPQRGAEPQQAVEPDADGTSSPGRRGRNARRLSRPADEVARPADGEAAEPAVSEQGLNGRKRTKQRVGRRAKPGVEEPSGGESSKGDAAGEGAAKGELLKEEKPAAESAKDGDAISEGAKSSTERAPEAPKADATKSEPVKSEAGNGPSPDPVASASAPAAASSSAPEPAAGPSTTSSVPPAAEPPGVADSAQPSASAPVAPESPVPTPK